MLTFQKFGSEQLEQIKEIYGEMGWTSYLGDDDKLRRSFDNSYDILGVFEDEILIGFIRCVGDGEHILLVQDLIIAKRYQKQGLGTKLFRKIWDRYAHVRMFQVNTDLEDVVDNHFYQSFGMQTLKEGNMISYFR